MSQQLLYSKLRSAINYLTSSKTGSLDSVGSWFPFISLGAVVVHAALEINVGMTFWLARVSCTLCNGKFKRNVCVMDQWIVFHVREPFLNRVSTLHNIAFIFVLAVSFVPFG